MRAGTGVGGQHRLTRSQRRRHSPGCTGTDGALAAWERGEVRPLARGRGAPGRKEAPAPKSGDKRPYEPPHYWAAFVLVGDPDRASKDHQERSKQRRHRPRVRRISRMRTVRRIRDRSARQPQTASLRGDDSRSALPFVRFARFVVKYLVELVVAPHDRAECPTLIDASIVPWR
jgi:hypothetical protein